MEVSEIHPELREPRRRVKPTKHVKVEINAAEILASNQF